MPSRKYEQGLRAESAEETRRRILEALYEHLTKEPSKPVGVDRIAREAGVARSTVYLIFGSRAGLFDALAADLFLSGEFQRVVDSVAQPDARDHLRGGFRGGAEMFATHRDVFRVLYSMAQLDASAVGGAVERLEEARAKGMARLAARLAEQDLLRPGLTVEEASHVIWLLASFDAFDLLYSGRGLSVEATSDLLIAMAERALYR